MAFENEWGEYVPAAKRRENALRAANKLTKKGQKLRPIHIESRNIATSFWGLAWCRNLEVYADWANRMPRGRSYARNGSIIDLQIETGRITSMVSGSSLYKIKISIDKLDAKKWEAIRKDCAQQVTSLLDLMRGKLPDVVLARITDTKAGMFPSPKELKFECSCPDYASMCKHVAATLYGVGHLLDTEPELFFKMRGVDQSELVSEAMGTQLTAADPLGLDQQSDLAGEDLAEIFGINLATNQAIPDANDHAKKTSVVQKRAQAKDIKRKVKAKAKSKTKSTPTEIDKDKSSGKSRTNKKQLEPTASIQTDDKAAKKPTKKKSVKE